jgi:hypothetical protein
MRDDPPPLVTREQVEAYVTPLLATSNGLITLAVKLARCEDNIATAKVVDTTIHLLFVVFLFSQMLFLWMAGSSCVVGIIYNWSMFFDHDTCWIKCVTSP